MLKRETMTYKMIPNDRSNLVLLPRYIMPNTIDHPAPEAPVTLPIDMTTIANAATVVYNLATNCHLTYQNYLNTLHQGSLAELQPDEEETVFKVQKHRAKYFSQFKGHLKVVKTVLLKLQQSPTSDRAPFMLFMLYIMEVVSDSRNLVKDLRWRAAKMYTIEDEYRLEILNKTMSYALESLGRNPNPILNLQPVIQMSIVKDYLDAKALASNEFFRKYPANSTLMNDAHIILKSLLSDKWDFYKTFDGEILKLWADNLVLQNLKRFRDGTIPQLMELNQALGDFQELVDETVGKLEHRVFKLVVAGVMNAG